MARRVHELHWSVRMHRGNMPNPVDVATVDIQALAQTVERLEARLAVVEAALSAATARSSVDVGRQSVALTEQSTIALPRVEAAPQDRPPSAWHTIGVVSLAGRTLIVLGGAYLLRALTEAAVIPVRVGAAAGFLYALVWLAQCARTTSRTAGASAVFYGLSAALVGFPLVWETTGRLGLVSPASGAAILGGYTGLLLVAARRARQQSVAWFAAVGAVITALILAVGTAAALPYTAVLVLVGIATLWLGYIDDWVGIRWPVAAAADAMVLVVTVQALQPGAQTAAAIAMQLSILVLYLGSFAARMLFLGREVIPFEVLQTAAAVCVGFGGALAVLSMSGASVVPLGIAACIAGAATYAFAFAYVEPRWLRRNLAFFTSLAAAFSLGGVVLVLPRAPAVLAIGALALLCAEWSRRSGRLMLAIHAFVFASAMAWRSGLLASATIALIAPASDTSAIFDLSMLLALITLAASVAWPEDARVRKLATAAASTLRISRQGLLLWTVSGAVVAVLAAVLIVPGSRGAGDAAGLAAIRTVVLAVLTTVLIALPGRSDRVERGWLGYAMLALVAIKLLAEDLPRGRPSTLFVALAVYGAALILAPRLARRPLS
jgi:hypothetical protein